MKRCPQCRRDYYDETLLFCLDDGNPLLDGPASGSEPPASAESQFDDGPQTAILSESPASSGGQHGDDETRAQIRATEKTAVLPLTSPQAVSPKNTLIAGALGIVVVTALGIGSYLYYGGSSTKQIESIAVMPFVNDSGNADVEYLSDGMTETLIRTLSQMRNLNVKARSSVFRYKGKNADAKTIGNELGVQAILNGHVVQRGDRLILNLELMDVVTENVIWTEAYDRNPSDLVTLQNEIARDVSRKLRLRLSGADQQRLARVYTNDPEAYRLFLQGRFYLNKRAGKLFDRAGDYLQQAIERDPNFALAYAALAEFVAGRDRQKAKEYTMRALAIDDQLSEAHTSLGWQHVFDYNWDAAEREFKTAIELDPNSAKAHQANGSRLLMLGKYEEALASYDRAIEIEPTQADIRNNRAACLVGMGKLDDAIQYIQQTMEMDPTFAWTHSHVSFIYRMKGDKEKSVAERTRAAEMLDQAENAKKLREAFTSGGWTAYLREIVGQDWGKLGTSETRGASFLSELGEKEAAIEHLEKAAARGDFWLFSIKYDPAFDGLREDQRFKALLKKFDWPG